MSVPKARVKARNPEAKSAPREDVNTSSSSAAGVHGLFETLLRRFRGLSFLLLLAPMAFVCCAVIGISAAPALWWFNYVSESTDLWNPLGHYLALGFALSSGYLLYGLCLIVVVPGVNSLLPLQVRPFRGPWYSLQSIPWFVHNALTYMVRYTFLDFITPSPLNVWFFRMMGMKIGRGVMINTSNISDPCLITLGDYVTVGGSATLLAHYGQKGYLVIAPVVIGAGTNIGLKASIMGGVVVGKNVTIRPHGVLLPKTHVPDGETV